MAVEAVDSASPLSEGPDRSTQMLLDTAFDEFDVADLLESHSELVINLTETIDRLERALETARHHRSGDRHLHRALRHHPGAGVPVPDPALPGPQRQVARRGRPPGRDHDATSGADGIGRNVVGMNHAEMARPGQFHGAVSGHSSAT